MEAGMHIARADHRHCCFSFSNSSLACDIRHCPQLVVALPIHHLQGSAESHSHLHSVIPLPFALHVWILLALILHLQKAQLLLHAFQARVIPSSCRVSLQAGTYSSCCYRCHCYHFVINLYFILSGFQDLSEKETEFPYVITTHTSIRQLLLKFLFLFICRSDIHILIYY